MRRYKSREVYPCKSPYVSATPRRVYPFLYGYFEGVSKKEAKTNKVNMLKQKEIDVF